MTFIKKAKNVVSDLLPEQKKIGELIRVIDVEEATGGRHLSVYMSLRKGRSVGVFEKP